jgi:SOS response regulatory protein OraA/RecX
MQVEKEGRRGRVVREGRVLAVWDLTLFRGVLHALPQGLSAADALGWVEETEVRVGLTYALSLLSRRALLSTELAKKLQLKGLSAQSAASVVQQCQGYLSDAEHVERWTHQQIQKGKSPRWIAEKLRQKGVVVDVSGREREALDQLLCKKQARITPQTARLWAQRLSRQGFSYELIRERIGHDN